MTTNKTWAEFDAKVVREEARERVNASLRTIWLGREIRPHTFILDIRQNNHPDDVFVLCFIPDNKYHKFVTWGFNTQTSDTFWGEYCKTLEEAMESLSERTAT